MLTYMLWREFRDSYKKPYIGYADRCYEYTNEELAGIFILSIVLTPLFILVDLVGLPIELIYLIILKVINKFRKGE